MIVFLMGLMFLINGLVKFAILPIAKQLSIAYEVDIHKGTIPVVISFVVFSLVNFPAIYITDTKGLRVSFIIGAGLFTVGTIMYVLIDFWYYFTIFGSIFFAAGQPFLSNCPAKIATYWFRAENVMILSSIETLCNFNNDRSTTFWHRCGLRFTWSSPQWCAISWGHQIEDICSIRSVFHLSISFFHIGLLIHEKTTAKATIFWSLGEKNDNKIIFSDN